MNVAREVVLTHVDVALFSAATWNGHLIHLDKRQAVMDGLDEVVVQSHFLPALVLAQLDESLLGAAQFDLTGVSWKNHAPLYIHEPALLIVEGSESSVTWSISGTDDRATMASGSVALRRETGPEAKREPVLHA